MGVKGSAAVRARQREVAARVERLITRADQQPPIEPGHRAEIRDGVRAGRAALRRRDRARARADTATRAIGVALSRIVAAGLSHAQAFEALGLTVGMGRRLLREAYAAQERRTAPSSTGSDAGLAHDVPALQPGRDSHSDARNGDD